MKITSTGLILSALMLPLAAQAAEDPRMKRPANLMATVCTSKGCTKMVVLPARRQDRYGSVKNPHVITHTMTMARCNKALVGQRRVIMASIVHKHGDTVEVRELYCKFINEQES